MSFCLLANSALAGVEQISEAEFQTLAEELAPKVNLFREAWKNDPKAEFYGGTTRDYLYWLKGHFLHAHTPQEAKAEIARIRALPAIDVREFIIGESDVDVVSAGDVKLAADRFGVRKIDTQSPDIFNAATEAGQNELNQGYIPAEKIRLGKDGFKPTKLGNGLNEIYEGKLSVHFSDPEVFKNTKYAKEGINHPVLLALRYLRIQAINYFRTHGREFPVKEKLLAGMDEASASAVKKIIQQAADGHELAPFLKNHKFNSWANGAIQKAFRSYTNPTAALELMREFGANRLPEAYPKQIEPINQYVFSKYRDEKAIAAAVKRYGGSADSIFTPASAFFPNGKLYHGTKEESAFRNIVFQGVIGSSEGAAGAGLYGVAEKDMSYSAQWGGSKDRLLEFAVKPEARIIDITTKKGQVLWNASQSVHNGDFEKFADLFGADILRYPYSPQAFVVKNAAVLGAPQGVHRAVLPFAKLLELAKGEMDAKKVLGLLSVNALSRDEKDAIWKATNVKPEDVAALLKRQGATKAIVDGVIRTNQWGSRPEVGEELYRWLSSADDKKIKVAMEELANPENTALDALAEKVLFENRPVDGQLKYKIKQRFTETKYRTDRLVDLAVKEYMDNAKVRGSVVFDDAVEYLKAVRVAPDQMDKLGNFFLAKITDDYNFRSALELFLEKKWQPIKTRDLLIRHIKKLKNRADTLWHLMTLWKKYLPEDKDFSSQLRQAFDATFDLMAKPLQRADLAAEDVAIWADDPKIREALKKNLRSGKSNYKEVAVAFYNAFDELKKLSESERIDMVDNLGISASSEEIIDQVVSRHPLPSPALQDAYLRAYLRDRDYDLPVHEKMEKMFLQPDPANEKRVLGIIEKVFDSPEIVSLVEKSDKLAKNFEVYNAIKLLAQRNKPITETMADKALAALEKNLGKDPDAAGAYILELNFPTRTQRARLQQWIAAQKLSGDERFFEKSLKTLGPDYDPKFLAAVKKRIEGWQMNTKYRSEIKGLQAAFQEASRNCPAAFQAIAPKKKGKKN